VQRAALDVGGHRHDEERPGEEIDDGRQPEGILCDHPEREEDRGYDRAEHDREDGGLAERPGDQDPSALGAPL
jgi:hypothetical protein